MSQNTWHRISPSNCWICRFCIVLFKTSPKFAYKHLDHLDKRIKWQVDDHHTLLNVSRACISDSANEIHGERKAFHFVCILKRLPILDL